MDLGNIYLAIEMVYGELLLFAAIWFLIGSLDDVAIDIYWILRTTFRKYTVYQSDKPVCASEIEYSHEPDQLAIFVPAWAEAGVLRHMLQRCITVWDHPNFRIYAGCYPNDHQTTQDIISVAAHSSKIRLVLMPSRGPTTKADCLNRLWKAMAEDDIREEKRTKAIILHDAEDMVHADELRIFDALVAENDLIQLPVIPLQNPGSRWVAGHYCDEFAEAHGKQMVVREALGASIPSAGVGCAFSREALDQLAAKSNNEPFDKTSLTEDYEVGLKIKQAGGRSIFVRMRDQFGRLTATTALFPDQIESSVRQKSRWMSGIGLAGWDRMGWQGGFVENWMRLRDRRAAFSAIVLATAYLTILLWGILFIFEKTSSYSMAVHSPEMLLLLKVNLGFLMWRLIMRAGFVWSNYGFVEAALSIPRSVISNIIAMIAARHALTQYAKSLFGTEMKWDKTTHIFPVHHTSLQVKIDE